MTMVLQALAKDLALGCLTRTQRQDHGTAMSGNKTAHARRGILAHTSSSLFSRRFPVTASYFLLPRWSHNFFTCASLRSMERLGLGLIERMGGDALQAHAGHGNLCALDSSASVYASSQRNEYLRPSSAPPMAPCTATPSPNLDFLSTSPHSHSLAPMSHTIENDNSATAGQWNMDVPNGDAAPLLQGVQGEQGSLGMADANGFYQQQQQQQLYVPYLAFPAPYCMYPNPALQMPGFPAFAPGPMPVYDPTCIDPALLANMSAASSGSSTPSLGSTSSFASSSDSTPLSSFPSSPSLGAVDAAKIVVKAGASKKCTARAKTTLRKSQKAPRKGKERVALAAAVGLARGSGELRCPFARCGWVSDTRALHRRHVLSHTPNSYACDWCGRQLSREDAVRRHKRDNCSMRPDADDEAAGDSD